MDFLTFAGDLPQDPSFTRKDLDVRMTALGVYKKQEDLVNNNNWYCNITSYGLKVSMWFDGESYVIGWTKDCGKSNVGLGWIFKKGMWFMGIKDDWIPAPNMKLYCNTEFVLLEKDFKEKYKMDTEHRAKRKLSNSAQYDNWFSGKISTEEFEKFKETCRKEEFQNTEYNIEEFEEAERGYEVAKTCYTSAKRKLAEAYSV